MIKDFKSFVFVSVDVKGVRDANFVSVDVKALRSRQRSLDSRCSLGTTILVGWWLSVLWVPHMPFRTYCGLSGGLKADLPGGPSDYYSVSYTTVDCNCQWLMWRLIWA